MRLKLLVVVWLLTCGLGFGQVTIFSENIGTGTGTQTIDANIFQNDGVLTFSGTADTRDTQASNIYPSASGGKNVFLNQNADNRFFQISDINLSIYENLSISFGARKSTNASNMSELLVEYSIDGTNYFPLTFAAQPTGTGTAIWRLISINLPTTVNGVPNLSLRWTNTSTTALEFRIDDIILVGDLLSTPAITISPSSIFGLDYIVGNGPSAEQTFTVSGTNLTNDITLTTPANFEISTTSGGGFGPNITLPQTGGNVANTAIYTRLVGGVTNGNYTGNINATSTGATAQNVAVSGTVIADVVITEIMYDTPGPDDLEWIEICNLTGNIQNIANYRIGVNGTTRFTFPAGANIAANACATVRIGHVTESPAPECPFIPSFSNPIGTTDILPNTGARTIALLASNGVSIADEVTYSVADGADGNGSTLHVIDATVDNSTTGNGNWSEVSNGGSPGVNSIIAPCAVQNIVVRGDIGSFPTIANGDTTPQGTDNTQFAAQTIGNSQDKTYRVANEGSLPLTISSIALSGDTADFTITQLPAFDLAVGTFDILEITFAPTVAGERNATVTITSDDPDTPVYTFAIRGTGNCAISSPTLSPTNGPVGTIVTLTGENFGGSTTLAYQGNTVAVTVISATQLEFEIPAGAGSGVAAFTNDIGCQGTAVFTVLNNTIATCEGSAGISPGDLFISEVTDATFGGLTYVEIFNATGGPVALVDYAIQIFSNGSSTPQYTLNLNAVTLSNLDTYVIAIGMSTSNCSVTGGDGLFANQNTTQAGINLISDEHDMIRLVKDGASIIVDEFGVYEDENWMDATIVTGDRGFNFRRLNTAGTLPRVPFNLADWEVIDWVGSGSTTCQTNNDYSDIGSYDFSLGTPPSVTAPILTSTNCLEAIISVTATEGFVGNNPITYQWFRLAPGDTNWTSLTDNGVYAGTDTNTLTINNTFNLNNYQYYCEVRENTATCAQASDAVRINIEQTTWDGFTWSNGVPDSGMLAILNADYTTAAPTPSFSACNLIVNAELDITDNYYVEVFNDAIVNAGGNVIVQTNGAFVQRNDAGNFTLNGGSSSVNKNTALKQNWYDYTYWSSPVEGETAENAFAITPVNRRFFFEANNYVDLIGNDIDDDGNVWQPASGILSRGVGYAATSSTIGMPFPRVDIVTFNGAFNTGIIDVDVFRNPANTSGRNWNFIGNPYPSAIDFIEFFNQNNTAIEGAAYLWSQASPPLAGNPGNENLNFSQNDYAIINVGSGNVAGGASGGPPSNYIGSGQGFFVNATGNGTVTFNNSIRETGNNTQFFRASNIIQPDKLWLNLTSDNGVFNQLLVAYVEGATNADDGMYYDAPRNLSTGTFASLYSTIENSNKPFAIQGKDPNSLRPDEVIALGFTNSITVPTVFTISIAQLQGEFMSTNTIFLKDNLLNLTHDLTQSNYNFTAEVGEFNQRFEIVFNRESLNIGDESLTPQGLSIIELPNGDVQFMVSQQHQIKEVTIVDLMGRVVYQLKGNHHTETYNLSQLSKAAYIAKVTLANGQTLHKKAIKRF